MCRIKKTEKTGERVILSSLCGILYFYSLYRHDFYEAPRHEGEELCGQIACLC